MKTLVFEMTEHLNKKILPFWERLKDEENGGFFGYVDYDLNIKKNYDKGVILNSRILWFFSSYYNHFKDESVLEYAHHAYKFLKDKMLDKEHKGLYWIVDYRGNVVDDIKHTYNQAFGIYALSEYYRATKDEEALNLAVELFYLIEERCKDKEGYFEEFDRYWNLKTENILSEYDDKSTKTMNTHLHILEAYTNLYRVWKDERIKNSLIELLNLFKEKIFCYEDEYLMGFFDNDFNKTIEFKSYGHDIEASWLLDRACEVLEDEELSLEIGKITSKIAEKIINTAFINNSLINETVNGKTDLSRVWWVQAEAIVGFFNAYRKTKDIKYLDASNSIWNYIKSYIADEREGGEWFWRVDENNEPFKEPIVEPWKCPYHNGRMCLEMIERVEEYV